MNYRELILSALEQIDNEKMLAQIYRFIVWIWRRGY